MLQKLNLSEIKRLYVFTLPNTIRIENDTPIFKQKKSINQHSLNCNTSRTIKHHLRMAALFFIHPLIRGNSKISNLRHLFLSTHASFVKTTFSSFKNVFLTFSLRAPIQPFACVICESETSRSINSTPFRSLLF